LCGFAPPVYERASGYGEDAEQRDHWPGIRRWERVSARPMTGAFHLLGTRRFLPLFATQLLGAFNDNLFKNAMVLFVVYRVYNNEQSETWFSAITTGVFILPFFLLSALSGQLADAADKARLIRIIKACEIGIMVVGGAGLLLAWKGLFIGSLAMPLMLLALFAMGVHSTFFGPIKYAILPQQLRADEVLGGTGLVEAGTYIAILGGTLLAGVISVQAAAGGGDPDRARRLVERPQGAAGAADRQRPCHRPQHRALLDPAGRGDPAHPAPLSSPSSRSASSGRSGRCCSSSSRRW
jgi:hypothetical protein